MKACGFPEEETGHDGRRDGSGHGGEEDRTGKVPVKLFQGEQGPCQRSIESSRQSRTGTAGNEESFLQAGPAKETGQSLGSCSADLDGRSFPPQGKADADSQRAAEDLDPENAEPFHFHQSHDDTLHLGNAGAAGKRGIAEHAEKHIARSKQKKRPCQEGKKISAFCGRHQVCPVQEEPHCFRFFQKEPEQADAEAAQDSYGNPFRKETETELMP